MNSLVVLLSVLAFAAAKPSGLLYSSPIIAGVPAAVSSQARLDIKSSPAIVATKTIVPISRTIIAEPGLVASPAVYTAAIAPAAVSSQSRVDIKSTPAITTSIISTPTVVKTAYASPVLATSYAAPGITSYLAPGFATSAIAAPAFIKTAALAPAAIAEPLVPLDTPEVVAARAAHLEAKNLAGAHLIRKRSVAAITPIATPVISTYTASAPLVSTFAASPLTYSTPLALSTPFLTKAYSVHPW